MASLRDAWLLRVEIFITFLYSGFRCSVYVRVFHFGQLLYLVTMIVLYDSVGWADEA